MKAIKYLFAKGFNSFREIGVSFYRQIIYTKLENLPQ